MFPDFASLLGSDNGAFLHWCVFISLILGGLGLPIPEDLPVLLAGIVIAKGVVPMTSMAFVCYAGVIIADLMIYGIGYKLGPRIVSFGTKSPFLPSVTSERVEKIREALRKRRFMCILIGRHLFPIRSVTFLTAGALRVPFLEFLISDLIAGFISVALMLSLGMYLGEQITPELFNYVGEELHFIAIALSVVIIFFSTYYYFRMKKLKSMAKFSRSLEDSQ